MGRRIALLLFCCGAAWGQHARVDGEWNWKMDSPVGPVSARVVLRTEGERLDGAFYFSDTRILRIEDGTIIGNELKFTVRRERAEGGTMVYQMMGRVSGNVIRGTARTAQGEPPVAAEWIMERALPAPRTRAPASAPTTRP
jgi:hypothetical protein